MAGLGPFDTGWAIPVVDTSLALRGLLAIPLGSRHSQMWFSRALESSPFSVTLQKQTNHFPAGKIGGPKELTSGQRGAGASLWEPAGLSEDKPIRLCYCSHYNRCCSNYCCCCCYYHYYWVVSITPPRSEGLVPWPRPLHKPHGPGPPHGPSWTCSPSDVSAASSLGTLLCVSHWEA